MLRLKLKSPTILPPGSSLRASVRDDDSHDMLPTTRRGFDRPPSSHSYRAFVARKYLVPFVCAAAGLYFLSHLFTRSTLPEPAIPNVRQEETIIPPPLPPLYSNYHYDVLRLPQHHWERTSPGSEEKFFYVAGHARGASVVSRMCMHVVMPSRVQVQDGAMAWKNFY